MNAHDSPLQESAVATEIALTDLFERSHWSPAKSSWVRETKKSNGDWQLLRADHVMVDVHEILKSRDDFSFEFSLKRLQAVYELIKIECTLSEEPSDEELVAGLPRRDASARDGSAENFSVDSRQRLRDDIETGRISIDYLVELCLGPAESGGSVYKVGDKVRRLVVPEITGVVVSVSAVDGRNSYRVLWDGEEGPWHEQERHLLPVAPCRAENTED